MSVKSRNIITVASAACLGIIFGIILLSGACTPEGDKLAVLMSQDCTTCHGATPAFSVRGATAGYEVSTHATGGNAYYANGTGCQRCHTHEGFLEFVATGKVDPDSYVTYPSQPDCFTCHDPHTTGDFSLRVSTTVTLVNGKEFDGGSGDICAVCHQSRVDVKDVIKDTEAKNVSIRLGPHHGPQSDLFTGTGAYEFPGKTYSNSAHTEAITDSCITCHMALSDGRYSSSPYIGGHSFNIAGEVHEVETLNAAGCLVCHKDMTQIKGKEIFSKLASADYDHDNTVEPLQLEVEGLLNILVNSNGTGLLQKVQNPLFDRTGKRIMIKSGLKRSNEIAALYNYTFFTEDRSLGIHNPSYTIQVLYDTIEVLDPSYDVSKRPK